MKRGILLILLIAVASLAQAQNPSLDFSSNATRRNAIDSIQRILVREKKDTAKAKLMRLLAGRYSFINRDSSLWHYRQSVALYQRVKDVNGTVRAVAEMVQQIAQSGNYSQAINMALNNLQLAERSKDTLNLILANRAVWRSYFFMDEFSMCLEYARKVKALVHSGYFKEENEKKAYSLFGYMNGMAEAFLGLNKMDSALFYGRLAYTTAHSLMEPQHLAITNVRMGHIYSALGNHDSAFFYFCTGIPYAVNVSRDDLVAWAHLGMAKLFGKEARTDSALYYGRLALRNYRRIKRPIDELATASLLTELYAKENRIDSAYKYQSLTLALKDSLFNQKKVRRIQTLEFGETLRMQQLERERKEAQQLYKTRLKLLSLAAGLIVVLCIAFMLYRNNRQKQKANILLLQQKAITEQALQELKTTQSQLVQKEKMASLGELTAGIAHEIQNPLNFVNNFSEINKELLADLKQEANAGNTKVVVALVSDIEENEEKISHHGKRADAIVKGMLQHSRNISGQKEPIVLNTLVDQYLQMAYYGYQTKDKAFHAEVSTYFDIAIDEVKLVPQEIGRVLLNLFNNAFYAVNEKKKQMNGTFEPVVSVSTKKEGNHIAITVQDNGTGMSSKVADKAFQPFFTTKPAGEGTGLGLSLSYDIITKGHDGALKMETKEGSGSVFRILLPINDQR